MKSINFPCLPTSVKEAITNLFTDPMYMGSVELSPTEERNILRHICDFIGTNIDRGEIASDLESLFLSYGIQNAIALGQKLEGLVAGIEKTIALKGGDCFSLFTVSLIVSGVAQHTAIALVEHDGSGVPDDQMEAILVEHFDANCDLELVDYNAGEYLTSTDNKVIYSFTGNDCSKDSELVGIIESTSAYVFTA